MFLVSAEEEVDRFGELILLAIKSQGVPTVLTVVQVIICFFYLIS